MAHRSGRTSNPCSIRPSVPGNEPPPWANAQPASVIAFDYNAGLTSEQNGANLAAVIQSLQPGERLEIGSGTYTIDSLFDVTLQGTANAPVWIAAQTGAAAGGL